MKRVKLFYIGCRYNPQFSKPYYKAYGQLSKADAKRKEDCAYGSMSLTGYDSKEAYEAQITNLKNEGYSVHK